MATVAANNARTALLESLIAEHEATCNLHRKTVVVVSSSATARTDLPMVNVAHYTEEDHSRSPPSVKVQASTTFTVKKKREREEEEKQPRSCVGDASIHDDTNKKKVPVMLSAPTSPVVPVSPHIDCDEVIVLNKDINPLTSSGCVSSPTHSNKPCSEDVSSCTPVEVRDEFEHLFSSRKDITSTSSLKIQSNKPHHQHKNRVVDTTLGGSGGSSRTNIREEEVGGRKTLGSCKSILRKKKDATAEDDAGGSTPAEYWNIAFPAASHP